MSLHDFEPRSIINGALIRKFIGKNVSIFVKVEDCQGQVLKGKTTDGHDIRVHLNEFLNVRPSDWIQVIGVPAGPDTIRSKEVVSFDKGDEEFDIESHNFEVQLLQHCTDVDILG